MRGKSSETKLKKISPRPSFFKEGNEFSQIKQSPLFDKGGFRGIF
jgi:hypothetical protein